MLHKSCHFQNTLYLLLCICPFHHLHCTKPSSEFWEVKLFSCLVVSRLMLFESFQRCPVWSFGNKKKRIELNLVNREGIKHRDKVVDQKLTNFRTRMSSNIAMIDYRYFFFWHTLSQLRFYSQNCVHRKFYNIQLITFHQDSHLLFGKYTGPHKFNVFVATWDERKS